MTEPADLDASLTIAALLAEADLPASPTPRLDAEWLLAEALGKATSYLRTWPERDVPPTVATRYRSWLQRRRQGEPVAYILGRQGFWSLELEVAADTLIPRPDTEVLVETALAIAPNEVLPVLDLGTGTGAIALALASERPAWSVIGVDRLDSAVALAERNRTRLGVANAGFLRSDWYSALGGRRFRLIVSNPPYIAEQDPHLSQGDVRYEPRSALVSGADGLRDLRLIIGTAPQHLDAGGWLLLEHGYDQGESVRALLQAAGFEAVETRTDLAGQPRVTLGRLGRPGSSEEPHAH